MPTYIAQGRFTRDAVRGMIQNPEDRQVAVVQLFESVGAKLLSWYLTSGEYDWLCVVDAPSHDSMVTAAIVAAGGGGISDVKTFAAWTSPQAKAMFEKAQNIVPTYKSAGGLPYGGSAGR